MIIKYLRNLLAVLLCVSANNNFLISDNCISSKTVFIDTGVTDEDLISVALTGDIMLGTFFPDSTQLPKNEGKYLMRYITSYFLDADIVCGNLEGCLADTGGTIKSLRNPDSAYYFKMPIEYAQHLKEAGYDFLSLANNHIFDFGHYGKNLTKQKLDEVGIAYAGLIEKPWAVIEKQGVKYGFIAFAPNQGTLDIRKTDKAAQYVQELSLLVDIVIVSFHGGGEGSDFINVTREEEYYMGENRGNIYEFSHAMIDAGADIVFGHGPHLTRAAECYNKRIIFYSLGNFCTYGRVNKTGIAGIAPIAKVNLRKDGSFVDALIIPTRQIGKGIPVYDFKGAVIKELQRLSLEDFPESPLIISDDGYVSIPYQYE